MSGDYEDILNRSWDELPEEQTLPVGSYRLKSGGAFIVEAKEDGKNDCVLFTYFPIEPLEDVDADAMAKLGDYDISQNKVFHRIWIEGPSDWSKKVRPHVKKHGIEFEPGETPKESFARMKGSVIIAWLNQREYTDKAGETVQTNDPEQFATVED